MSHGQKIIKILATIFAIFLAVSIIGGIVGGIFGFLNLSTTNIRTKSHVEISQDSELVEDEFYGNESEDSGTMNYKTYDFSKSYSAIRDIDIEATINHVILQTGDEFHVDMKNVSTKCKVTGDGGVLRVTDSTFSGRSFSSWIGDFLDGDGFRSLRGGTITITLPKDFVANTCDIDAGTGSVTLNNLETNELYLEAGTGSIEGNHLTARFLDLECGTGSIDFRNVSFLGSDIEVGTGSVSIRGRMQGQNVIECGVGSTYLQLEDSQDAYHLAIEKGLGSITINGSSYSSVNSNSANASNSLSIEGGIGNVSIDFAKQF
ncbi:MAG: DUF4097 family beta strand repeat-containing protein [Acetivibrio sp.]